MAREINYEKIVSSEGFDMKVLGSVCELLNGTGLLEKNISHKEIKREVVVKNFMDAVQAIPKSEDDNIPDIVVKVFNEFMDVDEDKGFITVTADDLSEKKDEKVENTDVEKEGDENKEKGKKEKPPKREFIDRPSTIAPALLELRTGTIEEFAKRANEIYVKGRDVKDPERLHQSIVYTTRSITLLQGLGLIDTSEDGKTFTLREYTVSD